jgi:hypothetical protein
VSELSRADLRIASVAVWRDWLRDGVSSFTLTRSSYEERARALRPFAIDPNGHNPAGELEYQIRTLLTDRVSVPARACAETLEAWSLVLDGWRGAAMALRLAVRLGAPALPAICLRLLRQCEHLRRDGAEQLIWVMIRGAAARFTREQIETLGTTIGTLELWSRPLVTEFAALLARDDLAGLPRALLQAAPQILAEPHTGEDVQALARRLALDHGRETLRAAFGPRARRIPASSADEPLDVFRFRAALAEELGVASPEVAAALSRPHIDQLSGWAEAMARPAEDYVDFGAAEFGAEHAHFPPRARGKEILH